VIAFDLAIEFLKQPQEVLDRAKDGHPSLIVFDLNLEDAERHLICKMYLRCNCHAGHTAAALGLSRSAFYRRLEKYNL